MARRTKEQATVSLFPFLSILISMMGILAFIMIGIATLSAANPDVWIEIRGAKHTKKPFYVECHGDHLVLHPERAQVPLATLEATGSPFVGLMDRLARNRDREYIVFAIYPDGIGCFHKARRIAEARRIDLGFEPMDKDWRLSQERL